MTDAPIVDTAALQAREDALPEWIKPRLLHFHSVGGTNFEQTGWSYELDIAELSEAYRQDGLNWEGPTVATYLRTNPGITENQRSFAQSMAELDRDGAQLAPTISGMLPITGKREYEL